MHPIKNITQSELQQFLQQPKTLLLDVRERDEFMDFNIGGLNIPPHEITNRAIELIDYQQIVIACSNGMRSGIVAKMLQKKLANTFIFHLEEGVF